jgi:hypothetical protein
LGKEDVVMAKAAGAVDEIVRLRLIDLLCAGLLESVTVNVRAAALATAVGVPLIAPVDAFKESPAGSVPLVSDQI